MARKTIGIVCHPDDIHAELVAAFLRKKFLRNVTIISSNMVSDQVVLKFGNLVRENTDNFSLIWVRRKRNLVLDATSDNDLSIQLNISQSYEDALHEYLAQHADICINHPDAVSRMENKATQLRLATQAGFNVPHTLVSASYERVNEFVSLHQEVVIKNLRPQGGHPTGTFNLNTALLTKDNCTKSFAIYQERIFGRNHFRIIVLDHSIYAFRYESHKLDSRLDARNSAELVSLDDHVTTTISRFMKLSGLEMGIFDFKESDCGNWYFLEVNQQGAFAYLDPLSGFPILSVFAEFLHNFNCE